MADGTGRERRLTEEQHGRLDVIARRDPAARVVGWYDNGGYGVWHNEGPLIRDSAGGLWYVGRRGRTNPLPIWAEA